MKPSFVNTNISFFKHIPNPPQTVLRFPLTRQAKTQQNSMTRSTSRDNTLLNMPQQFATSSTLLPHKQSLSMPADLSYTNNDLVMI